MRALLWLGVRDYAETHRAIIDQEYAGWGPGWFFRLDSDLTEIAGDTISGYWQILLDSIGTDQDWVLEDLRILRAKQAEKGKALLFAKAWLEEIEPLQILSPGPRDLEKFAHVLFWASHFDIGHVIPLMCSQVDLDGIIEETPINTLADLIYAFHFAHVDRFGSAIDEFRVRIESRFKRETNTVLWKMMERSFEPTLFLIWPTRPYRMGTPTKTLVHQLYMKKPCIALTS